MFKNLKISKKAMEWSVLFGLLCALIWSVADFNVSCEQLRHNCLRLHIVANSDSAADQELKLKIRDEILAESNILFEKDTNLQKAIKTCEKSLPELEKIANKVIKENGFNYTAQVKIGDAFFETREYEDFTLPAGTYKSLIINVGKAKGKNWWCVIFPQVCIPAAGEVKLSQSVGKSGVRVAENPQNYEIRFKTVEIYESIKHFLKGE